ncbi:MAG: Hpt domain-containing protein [Peptococcaceae bacterium]|nr:Hpt domain-containing protein [Peptococcaceae bacterium]
MTYAVDKVAAELMIEPEDLLDVLRIFFAEAFKILSECEKAARNSDLDMLEKLCHSLKGASSNFRMNNLFKLVVAMEEAAKSNDLAHIKELLPASLKEITSIREQVGQYRSRKVR